MVNPEELAIELRGRIDSHFEWLLVRSNGVTFPLRRDEIGVSADNDVVMLTVLDDAGIDVSRIVSLSTDPDDGGISIDTGGPDEEIRLVPRTPASELGANVEYARLAYANSIATALLELFPFYKLTRLALNIDNGRLAQIFLQRPSGDVAMLCDTTSTMVHEAVMTSAMLWLEKLQVRKKPIFELWIAAERKQARNLRKLIGLFNKKTAGRFRIFEISNRDGSFQIKELGKPELSQLWREKPRKISLPADAAISETAERIVAMAPGKTDVIFSKHGETIRYLGLPFARIRKLAGREKAWFGIDRNRRQLSDANSWKELASLIEDLETNRSAAAENKRHELYRAAPEAWLESILRRNIKQLDANLVLSPIYNQFRAASDKIDLLAIRRDGRLVIIELKTSPDRETVFQAADYWRKIELQRRRGELRRIRAFGEAEILDKPALVYVVAPALSFHRDFGYFAQALNREIEMWRFELREDWRSEIKVLMRREHKTEGK